MVMRISGLASGMDTDSIIKDIMRAQRIPMEKLLQKKQTLEWQRDEYRAFNTKFMEFRDLAFNMTLSSPYTTKKTSSGDEDIVTATANSKATSGTYKIKIISLAEAAEKQSAAAVGATTDGASTTLGGGSGLGLAANTQLTISGEKGSATIDVKTTDTITDFVGKVNALTTKTGVKLNYDATLDHFFALSTNTGSAAKVDFMSTSTSLLDDVLGFTTTSSANGQTVTGSAAFSGESALVDSSLTAAQTLRINYNGQNYDFSVDNSTTVKELKEEINASGLGTDEGVSIYLDSTSSKLVFFNPDDTKALTFSDTDGDGTDIRTSLGLSGGEAVVSALTYERVQDTGSNASIEYNTVPGSFSSNTFTINDITFTAKKKQDPADLEINVSVTQDIDSVYNSIKNLVDKYNELIDSANTTISQKRDRDYAPLTEEQKEGMSEDDIKLWEDKAKEGLLSNDSILSSGLLNMRNAWSNPLTGLPAGSLAELSEIGITTGLYSEKGKLYIDETKLRQAITDDPDEVTELFTADDGDTTVDSEDGLATKLHRHAVNILTSLTDKAGVSSSILTRYEIGKNINTINTQLDNWEDKLIQIEDRYYRQFTAMEKALEQMNSQSASLTQMFAS